MYRPSPFAEENAVSPVIGVVLMVAITVILAAVIASFVLSVPSDLGSTTSADFAFDYDGSTNEVTVTHEGGERIDVENLYIRGENVESGSVGRWDDVGGEVDPSNSRVASGHSVLVEVDSDDFLLRVVYEDGDSSNTIKTHRGPGA